MEQSFNVLEYLRQEAAALGAGGLNNSSVSASEINQGRRQTTGRQQ